MKLVRKNIFETNSSSTHALVVSHKMNEDEYVLYTDYDHDYSFGREAYKLIDHWDEKLAYVYTVLYDFKGWTENQNLDDLPESRQYIVANENLEEFKIKINNIYTRLLEKYKDRYGYKHEPKPDDIFNLIEKNEEIHDFKSEYDWFGDKYQIIEIKCKDDLKRDLNEIEVELTNAYQDDEKIDLDKVVTLRDVTDDEAIIIRLKEIFPDYTNRYCKDVYVDHTEDFNENGFLDKIIDADENYLELFIFNKESYITVGGDEYRGYNIKTIGFEYDYDEKDYPQYQVNEKGERCPDRSSFPDTSKGWEDWWDIQKQYPITRDNGGFWDRLEEYKKDHDVFLKGN